MSGGRHGPARAQGKDAACASSWRISARVGRLERSLGHVNPHGTVPLRTGRTRFFASLFLAALPVFPIHSLPAAERAHFRGLEFLRVATRFERVPELGREGTLLIDCQLAHVASLSVKIDLKAPAGLRILTPSLPVEATLTSSTPVRIALRLKAELPLVNGRVETRVRAPYPLQALKQYFARREPLYGETAFREFRRFIAQPPVTCEAFSVLQLSITSEEARIGDGSPPPLYLPAGSEAFAFPVLQAPVSEAGGPAWSELLQRLGAGTLRDPEDWVRLHAAALAKLETGRVAIATGVWREMRARHILAPRSAALSSALENCLAAGLALLGRYREAETVWGHLDSSAPSAYVSFNRATAAGRQGRFAEAQGHYRRALSLSPGYTRARERLSSR